MASQADRAREFNELHIKGDPVIIYNAWDGGSAKAIVAAGAKAIATGDHPVGYAHGFGDDDFDTFTFDIYLTTVKEIAQRIGHLPLSVDISNGEGLTLDGLRTRVETLLDIGIVGINFEDRLDDNSGIKPVTEQTERIRALRDVAGAANVQLFINARTDLFTTAGNAPHEGLVDEAVARAAAYREAGASGFFTPGLMDVALIKQLTDRIDLPLNIIRLPGAPSTTELKAAGVSRISYGPVPQMEMTQWLKDKAAAALNGEV